MSRLPVALALILSLSGCIGTAVSVATDVAVGTVGVATDVVVGTLDITTDVVGTAAGAVTPSFGGDDSDEG